ncbi:receptor-type tyrosine-protein phosphatase epsilon-like [Pecten maximus]|uniref:receptor-type tyrosine-protein phosphatase epsilon-like n=1 Tax=Pecten maximus TaxID=6579 RepID=UPI001457F61D|nr:receptor-type tyrosine-protein phosphatase epsilon-like [Pecten maximus]
MEVRQLNLNPRECEPGSYGDTCDKNCTSNCLHNVCNQTSGLCIDCDAGYYSAACNESCPPNCKELKCDRSSGNCSACKTGHHGDKCDGNCSQNCLGSTCNQRNGQCVECTLGYFTTECNQSCPINCRESSCDRISGDCPACKSGYYGMKCLEICGQCRSSSCSMPNGTCECSDGWEGDTCVTRKATLSATEDHTGMYAGVGVGAVIGVVLLVIASIVILRRKRLSSKKEGQVATGSNISATYSNVSPSPGTSQQKLEGHESSKETKNTAIVNENGLVYVNMHDISLTTEEGDVTYSNAEAIGTPIHELRSIIDRKMANKAIAFQEEFKRFPWGAVLPHEAGKNPKNKARNRFKTTFPYDHSRIILERIENDNKTTYINANYIDSVETSKMYIASQGPKPNTVDDFWRMVWQVSSGKIVMLTNLIEGGINKCYKYWPDEGEPLSTPTFHLTLDREMTYAFYVIRDISVAQKKTNEKRQVQQFHFTTWPDHGIPDTLELVLFHLRVKSILTELTGQMVVHCSAGLGRTGTFIALDALLTHGKETGRVDIPRYVTTMRKDRMNMIQTYEQYIALHELLVEGFNLQESHISRAEFQVVLATMHPASKPANQTKIHHEFKALRDFSPSYSPSCFKTAMLKVNKDKNRNMNILPADQFRVFLQSQSANRTDYINAIIVQSYTSKSGYIVTQFPLENTLGDFWTMIFDCSCESLVVLGHPTDVCWLEEDESKTSTDFTFKKLNERSVNADLTTADYHVTEERNSRDTTVRIFTLTTWPSDSLLPPSDSSVLVLLEQVDSRRRSDNTKPVVVMCRDGCTQSGLFCCISNVRDQMKIDEEVDIFQTARILKKRRPEALEDVKQYQYCYDILGQYLDSTDVYIN